MLRERDLRSPKPAIPPHWRTPLGKKIAAAATGIPLMLFLLFHLLGNLRFFSGRDIYNGYGEALHDSLFGCGIWIGRVILGLCLCIHVAATVSLTVQNRKARPQSLPWSPAGGTSLFIYCTGNCSLCERNALAQTLSSRIMIWSGLAILAFLLFHVFHFNPAFHPQPALAAGMGPPRHDTWQAVADAFSKPHVSLLYAVAVSLLCSHLSHGALAIFQTIGLLTARSEAVLRLAARAYTLVVWAGFLSVPCAVLLSRR